MSRWAASLAACVTGLLVSCTPAKMATPWYLRPLPMTVEHLRLPDGTTLEYGRILPPQCHARGACPVVVALAGGAQTLNLVQESLRPWAQRFYDAGWVVVSPVAPGPGQRFYERGAELLAPFLADIRSRHLNPGSQFRLFGVSNGGISAFRLAQRHPTAFEKVVVAPGFALADDVDGLAAMGAIDTTIFVGERDAWRQRAATTHHILAAAGGRTELRIVPDAGHNLASLPWPTLATALTPRR